MNIQDRTPETRDMWHRFYEGGGQEDEIFVLCRKLETERDQARNDFNGVAKEACQLQDALGCPCEIRDAQEKAMERIRDLIAAEGELGDAKEKIENLEAECTRLHGHWHAAEERANVAEARLAKAHKALTVCDGAMMGKVKPSSVAFKLIREIMYPESTWKVDEPADGKPDGQEENDQTQPRQ